MSYTIEPWKADAGIDGKPRILKVDDPNIVVATVKEKGDCDRIVACVNACAGIEKPEAVRGIFKTIEIAYLQLLSVYAAKDCLEHAITNLGEALQRAKKGRKGKSNA